MLVGRCRFHLGNYFSHDLFDDGGDVDNIRGALLEGLVAIDWGRGE